MIPAYARFETGGEFEPIEYDPGERGPNEVERDEDVCGICYSDPRMVDNEWGIVRFPLVPVKNLNTRMAKYKTSHITFYIWSGSPHL